jgi:hypothetical protein
LLASLAPRSAGWGYRERVSSIRRCSRSGCTRPVRTTLTYVYADSTAVLGPLAAYPEPHSYDLCDWHSDRLTVPQGWSVMRMAENASLGVPADDMVAIADAVRGSGAVATDAEGGAAAGVPRQRRAREEPSRGATTEQGVVEVSRRGHLRVLRSSEETLTP